MSENKTICATYPLNITLLSIDEVISNLLKVKKKLAKDGGGDHSMFCVNSELDEFGDTHITTYIQAVRPETNMEAKIRLKNEHLQKESRRKHYEMLKKEFENG